MRGAGTLAGTLAACLLASAAWAQDFPKSGFLEDYSVLKENVGVPEVGKGLYTYRAPALDPNRFVRLIFDDVEVWYAPDSPYRGIDPDRAAAFSGWVKGIFSNEIAKMGRLLVEPGPGIMSVSMAVTNVSAEAPRRGVKAMRDDTPYGDFILRDAVFELMLHDSVTGELLGEFIFTDLGKDTSGSRLPREKIEADMRKIAETFAKRLEAFYE